MNNLEDSISKLTTIPVTSIKELFTLSEEIVCDEVLNEFDRGEEVAVVDIGIGKLSMLNEDDGVEYKFIPSAEFETMLVNTLESGSSPLIKHINKEITKKVLTRYKNLM